MLSWKPLGDLEKKYEQKKRAKIPKLGGAPTQRYWRGTNMHWRGANVAPLRHQRAIGGAPAPLEEHQRAIGGVPTRHWRGALEDANAKQQPTMNNNSTTPTPTKTPNN